MHSNCNMFKLCREEWRLQPNHVIAKNRLVNLTCVTGCTAVGSVEEGGLSRNVLEERLVSSSTAARCLTPSPHSARNQTIDRYPPHLTWPPPQCKANIFRFGNHINVLFFFQNAFKSKPRHWCGAHSHFASVFVWYWPVCLCCCCHFSSSWNVWPLSIISE